MAYALARSIAYYDMPAVRQIVHNAADDNYRFSSLVLGVVQSGAFQMRKVPDKGGPEKAGDKIASAAGPR
jgi:hypothetical protein